MLADPKKRSRYLLQPQGKPLYEDPNRFGTRMLEKMGWSKGKGLGADMDGAQDFIRVRYKQDQNGMGFSDKDTQWTQHENDFNSLLQSLGDPSDATANKEDSDGSPKVHGLSGESLEKKSSNSRARVHYKKFTRGKDISQYNEKELANIFGKKTLTAFEAAPEIKVQHDKEDETKEPVKNLSGVVIIESELSVQDYFKAKMDAIKRKSAGLVTPIVSTVIEPIILVEDQNDESVVKKKSKKKKKNKSEAEHEVITDKMGVSDTDVVAEETIMETTVDDEENKLSNKKRKKNKSKKSSLDVIENAPEVEVQSTSNVVSVEDGNTNSLSKKSKKRKRKENEEDNSVPTSIDNNVQSVTAIEENIKNTPSTKKSKKRKHNNKEISEIFDSSKDVNENGLVHDVSKHLKALKQDDEVCSQNIKKSKKIKNKQKDPVHCESTSKDTVIASIENKSDDNSESSEMSDEERKKNEEFLYTINAFSAEKFKYLDIDAFQNSNCGDIIGYGIPPHMKIDVVEKPSDGNNILSIWETALTDKYGSDVLARDSQKKKAKKKKYDANALRKKNIFTSI